MSDSTPGPNQFCYRDHSGYTAVPIADAVTICSRTATESHARCSHWPSPPR
jgi:hypothetical protein